MAEDRTGVVARLDALEAAHKAATRGKWKVEPNGEISDGEYALVIGRGPVDCMAYCYGGTSTFEGENLPADAAAIVAEHNSYGHLLAAVRGVLESHVPSHAYCVVCDKDRDVEALGNAFPCDHYASFCRECDFAWPCRTVSTVAAALGEA